MCRPRSAGLFYLLYECAIEDYSPYTIQARVLIYSLLCIHTAPCASLLRLPSWQPVCSVAVMRRP